MLEYNYSFPINIFVTCILYIYITCIWNVYLYFIFIRVFGKIKTKARKYLKFVKMRLPRLFAWCYGLSIISKRLQNIQVSISLWLLFNSFESCLFNYSPNCNISYISYRIEFFLQFNFLQSMYNVEWASYTILYIM